MEKTLLLHVFVCVWNEEKIIQDFIDWYRSRVPDCAITVYNNMSTDNTKSIALQNNCEVIDFDTADEMDEQTLIAIRNNCWKSSQANWCLVVDADELVDITDNLFMVAGTANIFKCEGYEMFGTEGDTIQTLNQGCLSVGYSKPVLFQPWKLEEINFAAGSHNAEPIAKHGFNVCWSTIHPHLYHTKWRSWSNGFDRAKLLAQRRSDHSKRNGWNIHYEFDESIHRDYYENGIRTRIKIQI